MEFNDHFYQNLFRLVASPAREEASVEILRILRDVQEYYAANGISELWRDAQDPSADQDAVPLSVKHVDKPVAPVKRDAATMEFDGPKQHHSSHVEKSLNKQEFQDFESDCLNDTQDSLNLVANFEEDDESVDVIQQSTDCLMKMESDQPARTSVIVQPTSGASLQNASELDDFPGILSSIPLDFDPNLDSSDPYFDPPSSKIRRVAFDSKSNVVNQQKNIKVDQKTALKHADRWGDELEIACAVCKQLTFKPGNVLLECHDCNIWFHQKCHEPNILDVNDSRMLWHCSKCSKKIKKENAPALKAKAAGKSKLSHKGNFSTADFSSKQKEKDSEKEKQRLQFMQAAAKRVEPKHGQPMAKPVALLAADFLAKHKNRSSTAPVSKASAQAAHHSTTFPTVTPTPPSGISGAANIGLAGLGKLPAVQRNLVPTATQATVTSSTLVQAAEKRLQLMKKRAAGKACNK